MSLQREFIEQTTAALNRSQVADERMSQMESVSVGQTESEVIYRENKLELHRYRPPSGVKPQPIPLLIVYALINRPYILDLQPDRSVIKSLVEHGFTVYLIDWGEPSRLDSSLGLADYVDRYLDNCVDHIREHEAVPLLNLLGYCMGGTMSVMYAARNPEKIRNLGLMAAGLCFDDTGGVLELWGGEEYFSPESLSKTYGNIPAEFLDIGFALMDPVANTIGKYARLYDNLEDEEFVENFARMEQWLDDGIDVAGRAYAEFLTDIYQSNALYENRLQLDGTPVDLANITMPVLQIVGTYDHLIPPESSTPLNEVIPSEDTTVLEQRTGHIGLSVSSRSHEELWPAVCEWYERRSDAEETPTTELQDIAGIGPTYASRLVAGGIESPALLASASADHIAELTGVNRQRAADWIAAANELPSA